jgi:hypothetical protein
MKPLKTLVISMVGIAAILAGYVLHNHIVKVKAARMEHAVAPAALLSRRSHLDKGYKSRAS